MVYSDSEIKRVKHLNINRHVPRLRKKVPIGLRGWSEKFLT